MATTMKVYGNFPLNAIKKLINDMTAAGSTIKVALLTSSYTFDQDNHTSWADVSTYESSGTGYTTGGAALSNKTGTYASRVTTWDCDNITWTTSTISDAQYAVFYDATPAADADKKLICCANFGEAKTTTGGTFGLNVNASGLLTITVAA